MESLVKQTKRCLHKVVEGDRMDEDKFNTALCLAEELLNSRPLGVVTDHPDAPEALTPLDFLQTGSATLWEATDPGAAQGCAALQQALRLAQLKQTLWQRFASEVLTELEAFPKWKGEGREPKEGEVVVSLTHELVRGRWPLARVVRVYPGRDDRTRVVEIKLGGKIYTRHAAGLAPIL